MTSPTPRIRAEFVAEAQAEGRAQAAPGEAQRAKFGAEAQAEGRAQAAPGEAQRAEFEAEAQAEGRAQAAPGEAQRAEFVAPPQTDLRPPKTVMRLARMGSFFPTRLSFMRTVIRTLAAEGATVTRPVWEMDDNGFGRAVYSVPMSGHTYSLIAYSNQLDPEHRTDRVIAEEWDTSFVLFDGVPTAEDLDRIQDHAPRQEAGRFLSTELTLSRANKSVRLFEHVASRLAEGKQPDTEMIQSIGYLMRTTAVYGNGKFGIADRTRLTDRPGMTNPFRPELLTVWLIRGFTLDLVEHVARRRSPETFVPLDRHLRRYLGIGNATGLGMAPFLVSHPILINNWMMVRETALARVRAIESLDPSTIQRIGVLLDRVRLHLQQWNVEDHQQMNRIRLLRQEMDALTALTDADFLTERWPIDRLVSAAERCSLECQELVVALAMEPFPELVDGLTDCMGSDASPRLDASMTVSQLTDTIEADWSWALDVNFALQSETAQFWYVSEEKLEPRLGSRHQEAGAEQEQPLDVARQVQTLHRVLRSESDSTSVAAFLMRHPQHRFATRRVQTLQRHPYAEIRDNLIGSACLPIDMLRSKLSFFGAAKFDPKSDRWTRITLYQGAPLFDEIASEAADDWWLPVLAPTAGR